MNQQQPTQPMSPAPTQQGGGGAMKWILIILVIILLLAGAYYFLVMKKGSTATVSTSPSSSITTSPTKSSATTVTPAISASVPADWKTYTSSNGYTMKYPSDWTADNEQEVQDVVFTKKSPNNQSSEYAVVVSISNSTKTPADYMLELKNAPLSDKQFRNYGDQSSVQIGTESGVKFSDVTNVVNPGKWDWYLVSKNDKIYIIKVMKVQGEGSYYDLSGLISQAETMITTFKFTN